MKKVSVIVIAMAAALLMGGCAAKDEQAAHKDIKGHTITIATGDFFEACDKWTPGDRVSFSFTSSKPVMFDVHYHAKTSKIYPIEKTLRDTFEGSFVVQTEDIHCCMWQNNNPDYITLTYDMSIEKQ